jgi:hypothetical protein
MTAEDSRDAEELEALIRTVERDTCRYLIGILQTIINEQVQAHSLDKQTGTYIIDALEDQARRKGWMD